MSTAKKYQGHDEKRQKILDTAMELITRKGVADTSLMDVARAAGVSKGAIYHYFDSKSALVFDVTRAHFDAITKQMFTEIFQMKGSASPDQILAKGLKTVVGSDTRSRLHIYLLQEALSTHPELMEPFHQQYRQWHQMISQAVITVIGDEKTGPLVGTMVQALVDGLTLQALVGMEDLKIDEISSFLIRLWDKGADSFS